MFALTFLFNACQKDPSNTSSGNTSTPSGKKPGKVTIKATWSNPSPWNLCKYPYTVVIGLGYSSTDVANEAFFSQSSYFVSPANYTKDGLAPGTYYYRAKKTYNASSCGTGQGIPQTVIKSGAFTIKEGKTHTENISLN